MADPDLDSLSSRRAYETSCPQDEKPEPKRDGFPVVEEPVRLRRKLAALA